MHIQDRCAFKKWGLGGIETDPAYPYYSHQLAAVHDKKSVSLAALMHQSTEQKALVHMVKHMIFSSVLIIN